jgi:hypothetical protein
LEGAVLTELSRPEDFASLASLVTEEQVAARVVCGVDVERHLAAIAAFAAAGFDRVYVHQVGPDQDAFFRFYGEEVLPRLSTAP